MSVARSAIPSLIHQREDADRRRGLLRRDVEVGALLAVDLVVLVGVCEECVHRSVHAERRFDDVRCDVLAVYRLLFDAKFVTSRATVWDLPSTSTVTSSSSKASGFRSASASSASATAPADPPNSGPR